MPAGKKKRHRLQTMPLAILSGADKRDGTLRPAAMNPRRGVGAPSRPQEHHKHLRIFHINSIAILTCLHLILSSFCDEINHEAQNCAHRIVMIFR
jgi:hypothetical protein